MPDAACLFAAGAERGAAQFVGGGVDLEWRFDRGLGAPGDGLKVSQIRHRADDAEPGWAVELAREVGLHPAGVLARAGHDFWTDPSETN